jgi:hypothetical protein
MRDILTLLLLRKHGKTGEHQMRRDHRGCATAAGVAPHAPTADDQ